MFIAQNLVSVQWLQQNLQEKNLVLLEASLPKVGSKPKQSQDTDIQIVGTRNFDLKNIFRDTESALPNTLPSPEKFTEECQKLGINKNSLVVIYDNLGVYSSPRAWWLFRVMGHENVAVLDRGLPAWVAQNLPTELKNKPKNETQTYEKGNFVARFRSQLYRDAESVFENIKQKRALVVDARSTERFAGKTPEPRQNLRSGHIPDSVNLPYNQVLNGTKLKPQDELEIIFDALNYENKPLIFSCGSGVTACILLLASEIASGVSKAVYDGSWTEWGQLENYPIETA